MIKTSGTDSVQRFLSAYRKKQAGTKKGQSRKTEQKGGHVQ